MRVERIPEWALTQTVEAQVVALLARTFTTDFGGRSFFQQRHHLRLLAFDGDALVGHIAMLWRAVRLDDRLVTIAGLAEVATDPDRRGEGIAGRLLALAIAEAKASNAAFLTLFGTAGLYAAAGFREVHNRLKWVGMDGARLGDVHHAHARHLMVLPLGAQKWDDAAELDLIGNQF
ncbi:GNAT family N-acetyltransferase [Neotabrizicola shimadae]|uniref:GNAT family N-acetyltransferase n=1 Tax=Neotabrizicola shimadae TaxID=2807096 RepID=A0A8G1EBT8_9RHOB|nr:GNAT family N-acetyltransferase [Neotabrizicola shimadae]QYZ69970.1 GNAT family N-acetyltransferase [Neotabrizicola shimadae]